ncbi:hypothetical protein [Pontibacter sp. SGAir0037]|uniref:hypothetical protein n=1 Tax=Pontibacter sp. SGAir0037 TaxID=2571030 RepID=UPI001F0E7197|nr:hypothetical protein [Pontibacter sp. SGAir0037]
MDFKIVENSLFARVARMVLKSSNVAMVLGNKIHLSGVNGETFLKHEQWVAHELCHIRQFKEHGYARFLWLYLLESMRKGYYQNKYEVEAREAALNYKRLHLNKKGLASDPFKPAVVPVPADKNHNGDISRNTQ